MNILIEFILMYTAKELCGSSIEKIIYKDTESICFSLGSGMIKKILASNVNN